MEKRGIKNKVLFEISKNRPSRPVPHFNFLLLLPRDSIHGPYTHTDHRMWPPVRRTCTLSRLL